MKAIFGLDFGTTNTALSVNKNTSVEMCKIDPKNNTGLTLKSVIYFDNETKRFYIGNEAVENYIENYGNGRYIQSVKAFLPDKTFESTEIGGKNYPLDSLISMILKKAKDEGENKLDAEVDSVILGRPAYFSKDLEIDKFAENRLIASAHKAGFKNVYLQLEPIAAALTFERSLEKNDERLVLVGDFGGGTSDFTVIKLRGGNKNKDDRKEDILSIGGIYIGGDTFDSRLMWGKIAVYFGKNVKIKHLMSGNVMGISPIIINHLKNWHLIPFLRLPKFQKSIAEIKYLAKQEDKYLVENLERLIDEGLGYLLFLAIEKAKCQLSSQDETFIEFEDYKIREKVNRKQFSSFIDKEVEGIVRCVDSTIKKAGLKKENIDDVFLTGGSSHIPLIRNYFIRQFGINKIRKSDAFTSVSYGLGVTGSAYL